MDLGRALLRDRDPRDPPFGATAEYLHSTQRLTCRQRGCRRPPPRGRLVEAHDDLAGGRHVWDSAHDDPLEDLALYFALSDGLLPASTAERHAARGPWSPRTLIMHPRISSNTSTPSDYLDRHPLDRRSRRISAQVFPRSAPLTSSGARVRSSIYGMRLLGLSESRCRQGVRCLGRRASTDHPERPSQVPAEYRAESPAKLPAASRPGSHRSTITGQ